MTSTVTSLIELAADHGLGIAFLIVGGQVLLDRLRPLEFVASRMVRAKRSAAPVRGAHRRVREPRHDQNKNFCFSE